MFSETRRQVIHISMVGFALALRYLSWWQAALCALAALAFNALVLPQLAGTSLSRPVDKARGYVLGILLYPLAVLLLIAAFPGRPDIASGAWAILACGDGAATLVGRRLGRHPLPWNPAKTVEGSAAFVLAATLPAVGLTWWNAAAVTPPPSLWFIALAPLAAAVVAGLAETLPIELDDNITVPLVAGATLWAFALFDASSWAQHWPVVRDRLWVALAVNTIAATAARSGGAVRTSGMIVGWLIGVVVWAGMGWQGWVVLGLTFAAATVTSHLGLKRKSVLGIAEEREGRRGGGNAFANTGLAAIAAILAVTTTHETAAMVAAVAALVAGGSDTVASEIGKAWGGRTYLVTTFRQVRPGTPGAMSFEGTAAGLASALAMAWAAAALGLVPVSAIGAVVAGCVVGALVESAMAATLEGAGVVNNDVLNFVNTATAALMAVAVMGSA